MIEVVRISINGSKQTQYFNPNGYKLKQNITVIVETNQGLQFGKVVTPNFKIENEKINYPIQQVVRISTKKDYQKNIQNKKDSKIALEKCRQLVKTQNLKMYVIDAYYTFDRNKLIFRFLADNRIDFRQLAKTLASIYKTRIELRQIGIRDKAKEIGGYGPCGQKLCCARFLKEIDTVTINMAKNQNISLSPSKINGVCGRLLCCLKYENENYTKCRKCLPNINDKIKTEQGTGTVVGIDILKKEYKVNIENKGIVTIKNGSN